jgi:peptidoglycan/xylan/chitin deacetylase (PgdA/CDA1 family)
VCLTFDDAYVSALTLGCEILTDHEVTATFYAVPSLAGGSSEWDGDRARPLASWETLLQAQRLGFEIGNHTWSHPDLSALGKPDQLQQWTRADEALREHGLEPGSCCYPYGRMNSDSVDAVRLSGASVAVAIKKRRAKPDDDRLALPRIVIAYSDSMPKLLYKMYVRPLLP